MLGPLEVWQLDVENSREDLANKLDDVQFCREYWFHLGWLHQIGTWCQELIKEVVKIKEKVHSWMEGIEYEVKFLEEDDVGRETSMVTAKVQHMIKGLICINDLNIFQTGSHVRHMMKLHTWKTQLEWTNNKVEEFIGKKMMA